MVAVVVDAMIVEEEEEVVVVDHVLHGPHEVPPLLPLRNRSTRPKIAAIPTRPTSRLPRRMSGASRLNRGRRRRRSPKAVVAGCAPRSAACRPPACGFSIR